MIKVSVLHYNIRRQIKRFNSDYNSHISVVDLDAYINQSKVILLENLASIVTKNRTYGNNLKSIIISDFELKPDKSNDYYTNFKLPNNHYSTLSVSAIGFKNNCKDKIFLTPIKSHKIEESLRDPKWKPSFNWRESFYNENLNYISAYHNNDFSYESLNLMYIKDIPDVANVSGAPNKVYVKSDGSTITEDKHLEIDNDSVRRKIEDLAVMLIRRDMDENYKVNLDTILFSDKAFM